MTLIGCSLSGDCVHYIWPLRSTTNRFHISEGDKWIVAFPFRVLWIFDYALWFCTFSFSVICGFGKLVFNHVYRWLRNSTDGAKHVCSVFCALLISIATVDSAPPLTAQIYRTTKTWLEDDASFQLLKNLFCSAPILNLQDPSWLFVMVVDTSELEVVAVPSKSHKMLPITLILLGY